MALNILQLISSGGFFGAENVLLELSSELNALGQSVTIGIFNNQHNRNLDLIEMADKRKLKIQIFECRGRFDLGAVWRIASYIKQNTINIVHSHGYKSNIYSRLSTLFTNKPIVSTCHNWINSSAKMGAYAFLDKVFLRTFDAVIPVSKEVKDTLLTFGVSEQKITLIENGINFKRLQTGADKKALRRDLGIGEGSIVVGTIGRLSAEKGHRYFIEAAGMVLEKKGCYFLIVGDGPLGDQLKEQARALNIQERVLFAGKRTEIPQFLSLMDIFVLPSLTEGRPIALLEAMAARKPIIATAVGDVPTILKNGELGLLTPKGDSRALARGILDYLNDMDTFRKRGSSAFEEVKKHYSAERMAKEYLAVYNSLCNCN